MTTLDTIMLVMFVVGIAALVGLTIRIARILRPRPCSRCSTPLLAAAKFCGRCGLGVGEKAEAVTLTHFSRPYPMMPPPPPKKPDAMVVKSGTVVFRRADGTFTLTANDAKAVGIAVATADKPTT